jgi:hypothetical protein
MKTLSLTFLFSWIVTFAIAQDNRWSVSAENTLSFVNTTNAPFGRSENDNGYRAAYNAFLRTEYALSRTLALSIGAGYMQTREFISIGPLSFEADQLQSIRSDKTHHYFMAPVGLQLSLGSFFIRPEIGIGINTANTSLDEFKYNLQSNGNYGSITTLRKNKDINNIDNVNKLTYPLMLTMGAEIPVSTFRLILGAQGFYTLNKIGEQAFNQHHAFGFGTTVGIKF